MGKEIKILIFFLLLLGGFKVKAQFYLDSLNKQSNAMLVAFNNNDYQTLLQYTHPKIIVLMGGIDSAKTVLRKGMNFVADKGVSYININTGTPQQMLKSANVFQCILPQISEVKIKDKKAKATNYLLCISYNSGKNWYFINANKEKEAYLKKLIPEISKDLIIPEMELTYH
ncbi:hypothetical protein IM793_10370 [Pedobacter sp. MR2016-19]|uniref:hypothetical protein n=1 Tax=Pedobacter sp. MR2016-19 TaxID=2780089 RepID=UPI0010442EE3|nr:hypothetical protein [Pedobacter sp. MR2016-19]MBE5319566.1 hypothetical protein [Pedobacter sp. MR2016-19]